jgi:carbon storage regulator CsrA
LIRQIGRLRDQAEQVRFLHLLRASASPWFHFFFNKDVPMLVLARKQRQKVRLIIGRTVVEMTVLRFDGQTLRLGFEAPANVKILRSELTDRAA